MECHTEQLMINWPPPPKRPGDHRAIKCARRLPRPDHQGTGAPRAPLPVTLCSPRPRGPHAGWSPLPTMPWWHCEGTHSFPSCRFGDEACSFKVCLCHWKERRAQGWSPPAWATSASAADFCRFLGQFQKRSARAEECSKGPRRAQGSRRALGTCPPAGARAQPGSATCSLS